MRAGGGRRCRSPGLPLSPAHLRQELPGLLDVRAEVLRRRGGHETAQRLGVKAGNEAVALVLKTFHTTHGGKMSIARLLAGQAGDGTTLTTSAGGGGRVSGVFKLMGQHFEKRLKACIALSGPYEWQEIWDGLPELTRETFRVRSHSPTQAEAKKRAAALTLRDAAKKITCPLFIVAGRQDRLVPAEHAERLAKSVSGPVELLMVEDGGHNANNRPYRYRSRSADWLAAQFGLPKI